MIAMIARAANTPIKTYKAKLSEISSKKPSRSAYFECCLVDYAGRFDLLFVTTTGGGRHCGVVVEAIQIYYPDLEIALEGGMSRS